MKSITCIAIDDEPLALTIISKFCQRKGGINLSVFSEPLTGIQAIHDQQPDLVFLDIEMNGMNGLDIAQKLPSKCIFIFTTAHAQFALKGFDLDATDFLHKPFAYERFSTAVDKAIRRIEATQNQVPEEIIVKQEYNNIIIPVSDILYIEAMENYTKIFRLSKNYVMTRTNLKTIQNMLPQQLFVRVHKSFIVSLNHIASYSHNQLTLDQKQITIPIGRTYQNYFIKLATRKKQ